MEDRQETNLEREARVLNFTPKTPDEAEFGAGRWVFSQKLQRPIVTGTDAGPVSDRTLLKATNVDEAIKESAALRGKDGADPTDIAATIGMTSSAEVTEETKEQELAALRARGEELGIENANRMKAETLSTKIREAEEAQAAGA